MALLPAMDFRSVYELSSKENSYISMVNTIYIMWMLNNGGWRWGGIKD